MIITPAPLPDGAHPVPTRSFELVQQFCGEILERPGYLEVSGPPGHGKTYSVDSFCASTRACNIEIVKFSLASKAKGYSVIRRILRELGLADTGSGDELEERLITAFKQSPRPILLYGDEGDLINRDGLRTLRLLRDWRDPEQGNDLLRFGLVLVGSNFRQAYRLAPELESRVTRRVRFGRIEPERLIRTVRNFHPLYRDADAELIREIDGEHCRGEWRQWSLLTQTALDYLARTGGSKLSVEVVSAALGAIEG